MGLPFHGTALTHPWCIHEGCMALSSAFMSPHASSSAFALSLPWNLHDKFVNIPGTVWDFINIHETDCHDNFMAAFMETFMKKGMRAALGLPCGCHPTAVELLEVP